MAKREIINVDEDAIKRMIAGDTPIPPTTNDIQKLNPDIDYKNEKKNTDSTENKSLSRKKGKLSYSETFLGQQKYPDTRQTTIILDKGVYSSIRKVLKMADGLTFTNFINNILVHHFNENKEDIDKLLKEYISNLFGGIIMKIILYIFYLGCVLLDMICWITLIFCKQCFKVMYQCSIRLTMIKCHLSDKYRMVNNSQKGEAKVKENKTIFSPIIQANNIVGETKTIFMEKLPILRQPEEEVIKPFMSIPLEKVEDENYDNNEESENFGIENSNFQENDMDSFESNDYYDDSENTSSGVSFDELSDTVDALYNNNFTKNEEEKIVSVLDTINGTELFEFITINNTVYENAKLLMSSFNREEQESDNFNINQFL